MFKKKDNNKKTPIVTNPPASPAGGVAVYPPPVGTPVPTAPRSGLKGSLTADKKPSGRLKINLAQKSAPKPKKVPKTRYEAFRVNKQSLAKMLGDASDSMSELEAYAFTERLKKLGAKVNGDAFKVQIVGTFKNGKSTFINSFLGQEILPAYALPCTAVINEVRYGAKKRAVLYFKNPLPKELPQELSKEALAHMKAHSMKNVPPMEIPYDKIEEYVVIPMGKDPKDMLLESPYEKVVLYWPLELLKNGIQIIDSPGLNEHATRTKVTMEYLNKADAIIFVLNATALCALDEMEFIENNLKTNGFNDLFFVINRFDLIPEKEQPNIVQYAKIKLTELTSFGEDGLFFLSARDALHAKMEKNAQKLKDSGMADFEKALSFYLTKHRSEFKLAAPAREVKRILSEEALGKMIPQRLKMLDTSLEELKERQRKIKPKLDDLLARNERLREKIQINIQKTKSVFVTLAERNIDSVVDSIPDWVGEYTPSSKIGVMLTRDKVKNVAYEISSHLAARLEQNNSMWQESCLVPEMKKRAERIFSEAGDEIKQLMKEAHLAADESYGKSLESDFNEYVINVDYAAIYGHKDGEVSGGDAFARRVAGKKLMVMLTLTRPAAMWRAFSSFFGGKKESSTITQVKQKVAKEMSENMVATKADFANYVAKSVTQFYEDMSDKLVAPIDEEIERIESQMKSVIADMEAGKSNAESKKAALKATEARITTLCEAIEKYIATVSTAK